MIKYIGIAIFLIGILLLIMTIVSGRINRIAEARYEYERILSSGYVSEHVMAPTRESIYYDQTPDSPVMAAPRKRALSREGLDLLERVESQRSEERYQARRSGTDIISGTMIQSGSKKDGTAALNTSGTGTLSQKKGTETLANGTGTLSKGGTDTLGGRTGTLGSGTGTLNGGTGVLGDAGKAPAKEGTAPLNMPQSGGTGVLTEKAAVKEKPHAKPEERSGGTDILGSAPGGTGILTPKK